MSLTRKLLKSMGIEDDKIDQIIEAHTETTDALKAERDKFKGEAEELAAVRQELESLKGQGDDYEQRYQKEHEAFEAFRAEVDQERADAEKKGLYRELLTEAGVDQKRVGAVMRVADLDSITVKDGAIEDRDAALEKVKAEWSDFIPQVSTKPAQVETPKHGNGGEEEPRSLAEALRQKYQHTD